MVILIPLVVFLVVVVVFNWEFISQHKLIRKIKKFRNKQEISLVYASSAANVELAKGILESKSIKTFAKEEDPFDAFGFGKGSGAEELYVRKEEFAEAKGVLVDYGYKNEFREGGKF